VERVYLSHDLCTHVAQFEYNDLYIFFSGVGATLPGLEGRGSSALPHLSRSCKTLLLNFILSTFIFQSSKSIEMADC
jgi:hypothetical protein